MKHKGSIIPFITVDGVKHGKPRDIANNFGAFYLKLGFKLAENIVPGTMDISNYMLNIPYQLNSLMLKKTMVQEIDQLIKSLPNKSIMGMM